MVNSTPVLQIVVGVSAFGAVVAEGPLGLPHPAVGFALGLCGWPPGAVPRLPLPRLGNSPTATFFYTNNLKLLVLLNTVILPFA